MTSLKINEIFYSIQGESSRIGLPTIFIRLTGCPMRCVYCDTGYAFNEGKNFSLDEIIESIKKFPSKYITVTGGEPLAQKNVLQLLDQLIELNYEVSLETGGAIDIQGVHQKVKIILDIKTPKSGEVNNYFWDNLKKIRAFDEIKIVIQDKEEFDWAINIIKEYKINPAQVIFSPVFGQLDYQKLAEFVLNSEQPYRMQLQLHKLIWGSKPGV
ncbi:MAG: radical SAM protein [Nitrosomonadales bacterium]